MCKTTIAWKVVGKAVKILYKTDIVKIIIEKFKGILKKCSK